MLRKTNYFVALSFFLLFINACENKKTSVLKNETELKSIVINKIEEVLDTSKPSFYELPDSVIAEIAEMDSLLELIDKDYPLLEEEMYEMEVAYEEERKRLDSVSIDDWINLEPQTFKREQLTYKRVQDVYKENEDYIKRLLISKGIYSYDLDFYMRAFKEEGEFEIWAKGKEEVKYKLLQVFPFYQGLSVLGPKHREGDMQVPEGFYTIDYFNPNSSYKVSLRVNYPNNADSIRNRNEKNMGGAICIHGHTVSVGCLAITDLRIPIVYLLAVEAIDRGTGSLPIHIFPARLTKLKMDELKNTYRENQENLELWRGLKIGYDYFERTKERPKMKVSKKGYYYLESYS